MLAFRDSASIHGAVTGLPEIASLLAKRIEQLSEYLDYELDELVHIFVIEPRDTLPDVDIELGFAVEDRTAE